MTTLMQASRQWASRPATSDMRPARYAEHHDAAPGALPGIVESLVR